MTCACCHKESPALIVWQSAPREDGSSSVKLTICTSCSKQIEQLIVSEIYVWEAPKLHWS